MRSATQHAPLSPTERLRELIEDVRNGLATADDLLAEVNRLECDNRVPHMPAQSCERISYKGVRSTVAPTSSSY